MLKIDTVLKFMKSGEILLDEDNFCYCDFVKKAIDGYLKINIYKLDNKTYSASLINTDMGLKYLLQPYKI